ncbi:MAG: hypothetical protein PVG99_09110 [Desulfobacteraceae bacterium]|jgi:hypothetical protein
MERNRRLEVVSGKAGTIRLVPGQESWLPPWLFNHEDLIHAKDNARPIGQEALTNTINHIHFMDGYILVLLSHSFYQESIVLKATPEPCLGGKLTCHWADNELSSLELEKIQLRDLIIDDGRSLIMVPALVKEMNRDFLKVQIPETSYAVGERQAKRYACQDVTAELIQSGFQATGELLDFSPVGFRIRVKPEPHCSFRWFNSDERASIHIRRENQILFSGRCRCIRQQSYAMGREIVLAPLDGQIKRFKKKQIRNMRQQLAPSPSIVFDHPFLKKKMQREIYDISPSGFSVYEEAEQRVLLPGMIIPELTINFAGVLKMNCSAQVIYCSEIEGNGIRCGLAILDMNIDSYSRLTHILTNALDSHAHISNEVDMDALWEFFFRTGFIYPKKYRLIQSQRAKFKETYKKLYQENPEIARHFTYQKNGEIFGHISMVRAYDRAWMIHHHAAQAMDNRRTGFMVLKQIMHYLNDMHRLPSAHMDYVMCYFRPGNRFPDRVFGGFARELGNPRGCSLDLFAYLAYTRLSVGNELPEGWSLKECSERDFWALGRFYSRYSGGLLLDALSLGQRGSGHDSLEDVYGRLGLLRKCGAYALSQEERINALLIVNQSDFGFNLSELLNGIKVLVTNPENVPWNTLAIAIAKLTSKYRMQRVPIMFYPFSYVEAKNIPYEKQYQLWILNVQYGNEYLEYMQKKFRISYK